MQAVGLRYAFKEWAVICHALGHGFQTLILRKGGINERGRQFNVEHERFWLFPTYVHQQDSGLVSAAMPMLEKVTSGKPLEGVVRLSHVVEVADVHHCDDLDRVLKLGGLHFWSEETVRQRFQYRQPGLFVLVVRVFQAPNPIELPNLPEYNGCRSWVKLEKELSTDEAMPVMSNEKFQETYQFIRQLLR